MTAEQIYAVLDAAALTPHVHYAAAPHDWRTALESIEQQIEESIWMRVDAIESEIEAFRLFKDTSNRLAAAVEQPK